MRKWLYRLLAVVLTAGGLAALLLAGGTSDTRLFPELTQAVIADWPTNSEALEQSAELLGLDHMQRVAESRGTVLYYHETTGELAVKNAAGRSGTPIRRIGWIFDLLSQGHYTSLLYANVITANESEKTMYSFDDCMKFGQVKTSPMENGLRWNICSDAPPNRNCTLRHSRKNDTTRSRSNCPLMKSYISAGITLWPTFP